MWIESHQEMARHPKILRLSNTLKINKAQAIGHLHLLWWWTLDFAPSGSLSAFTSCEICGAAEWTGDADRFVDALKETGWLNQDGTVHDWGDYAGNVVSLRSSNRERQRKFRAKMNCGENVTRDNRDSNALVTRDVTLGVTQGGIGERKENEEKKNLPPYPPLKEKKQEKRERGRDIARFTHPTLEEVKEHIRLKGYAIDPEVFWNHYEASGWIRGKTQIRKWKACLVTWTKNGFSSNKPPDKKYATAKEVFRD